MTVVSVAASTGKRDFAAAAFGGDFGRLAHFHVAENVFQHDDRVVDQPRKRQRQSAENHRVDRAVAERQRDKRGQRRERNRKKHRDRRPHAAEKNQNHHARQHQADRAFVEQVLDRVAHKDGLVEHNFGHQLLRHVEQVRNGLS